MAEESSHISKLLVSDKFWSSIFFQVNWSELLNLFSIKCEYFQLKIIKTCQTIKKDLLSSLSSIAHTWSHPELRSSSNTSPKLTRNIFQSSNVGNARINLKTGSALSANKYFAHATSNLIWLGTMQEPNTQSPWVFPTLPSGAMIVITTLTMLH